MDNKKYPTFKEGDLVQFEMCRNLDGPRWSFDNKDNGKSSIWVIGTVTLVEPDFIHLKYLLPFKNKPTGYCKFAYYASPLYTDWQWKRNGFFRILEIEHNNKEI